MKNQLWIWTICCFTFFVQGWSQQPSLSLSLKEAEELAIQNNYSIQGSLHRLEQGYYGYRSTKDYFRLSVDLSAQLNIPKERHETDISGALRVTRPIYDKVAVFNLKESQIEWEEFRLQVQQNLCDVLYGVREAYSEVILHQAHLAVDEMILHLWQEELKRQTRQVELGSSIPYEVNQTQLYLKGASSECYATQKKIRSSQLKLLTVLGFSPDCPFIIPEKQVYLPSLPWSKKEGYQWKGWTLNYRPELKLQELAYALAENKKKRIKAEAYPTLSLYGEAGHRYINNGFDHQPELGVGVNVNWKLYDPSKKNRLKQAHEESQEVACHYRQLELEAEAETYRLLNEIEQSYEFYVTSQEEALLAEEGMRMAYKKYQLGLMSAFEYRDTIKEFHQVQQKVNQAKFDMSDAYYRLLRHSGVDLIENAPFA